MEKDLTNRELGLKPHKCRICGEEGMFKSYLAREMMQGTRDEFEYFVCGKCRCLQIAEIPDNLGDYYGSDYYSMKADIDPDKEFDTPVTDSTKILDVGCGSGAWLYLAAAEGHNNLYGCDPFVENDLNYGDRVFIKKCEITEMDGDGTFKAVRMADSFEHVTNPKEVLQSARRLLCDDGFIIMSLPTYPNIAFEMFGPHWYQLDAPRHIFLHSMASLNYLAKQCGLMINRFEYDSSGGQIVASFFYQHGVTYFDITEDYVNQYFSKEERDKIEAMSVEANKNCMGDHVKVWMVKEK